MNDLYRLVSIYSDTRSISLLNKLCDRFNKPFICGSLTFQQTSSIKVNFLHLCHTYDSLQFIGLSELLCISRPKNCTFKESFNN